MMYLTRTNDVKEAHTILYDTLTNRIGEVSAFTSGSATGCMESCIIDIDEQEACILALKGIQLFKVLDIEFETSINLSRCPVQVSDNDAIIEWRQKWT